MPDEEVRLIVSIAGQPKVNELVKKMNEGNASIAEMKTVLKALNKEFEAPGITKGTENYNALGRSISTARDQLSDMRKVSQSTNSRMMQDYFRTGLAVRQLVLNNKDLLAGMLGLEGASAQAVGQFANVAMSLSAIGRAAKASGIALSSVQLGIVGAILVLPSIIELFKTNAVEAEKLRGELEKINLELGRMSIDDIGGAAVATLKELRKEQAALSKTVITQGSMLGLGKETRTRVGSEEEILKNKVAQGKAETELVKQEFERFNLTKQRLQLGQITNAGMLQAIDYMLTLNLSEKARNDLLLERKKIVDDAQKKGLTGFTNYSAPEISRGIYEPTPDKPLTPFAPGRSPMKDIASQRGLPGFGDAEDELAKQFKKNMEDSEKSLENMASLTSIIAQNLNRTGDNFVAKMFSALTIILKMVEGIKSSQLSGGNPALGIISSIFGLSGLFAFDKGGWIREPVFGIGARSGAGYTFAENRPEYVSPSTSGMMTTAQSSDTTASEIRLLRQEMAAGRWRMKGRDMVYTYDKNKNILNRRTY